MSLQDALQEIVSQGARKRKGEREIGEWKIGKYVERQKGRKSHYFSISRCRAAILMAVTAASSPLLPCMPPALSSAC